MHQALLAPAMCPAEEAIVQRTRECPQEAAQGRELAEHPTQGPTARLLQPHSQQHPQRAGAEGNPELLHPRQQHLRQESKSDRTP